MARFLSAVAYRRCVAAGFNEVRPFSTAFLLKAPAYHVINLKDASSHFPRRNFSSAPDVTAVPSGMSLAAKEAVRAMLSDAKQDNLTIRRELADLQEDLKKLSANLRAEGSGATQMVRRVGAKGFGAQSRKAFRPSHERAVRQPTCVSELGDTSLAELAMQGNHPAQRERLLREIMCVDGCNWEHAHKVLMEMDRYNNRYYWLESMPYRIGICGAVLTAVVTTALVFEKNSAYWYGINIANEDDPEDPDIEEMSVNQIGSWTWTWMEPMIGTASFILLCFQFTRAQAVKLNLKTYGETALTWRAQRLARRYPDYDRSLVQAWARNMPHVKMNLMPAFERRAGIKGPSSGL